MGIVNRDKGSIFVDGMNYDSRKDKIRSMIGYLPQENIFDKDLNILENLYFSSKSQKMKSSKTFILYQISQKSLQRILKK